LSEAKRRLTAGEVRDYERTAVVGGHRGRKINRTTAVVGGSWELSGAK
jgi:hypothetical protein